jgi:hypothetical protein
VCRGARASTSTTPYVNDVEECWRGSVGSCAWVPFDVAADALPFLKAGKAASILRSGEGAKLSGRVVLGENWDDAIRSARRVRGEPGRFDVVGHGLPNAIYDAEGNALTPSELAVLVRGTPSWGGQDVRLLACSTGCPSATFAQALANELGVRVSAPTTPFSVNSRGGIVLDAGGSWVDFEPQ